MGQVVEKTKKNDIRKNKLVREMGMQTIFLSKLLLT